MEVTKEHLIKLAEGAVDSLFEPEHLAAYLTVVSRFPFFPHIDQILIYLQRPDATVLAGASKWKGDGFSFQEKTKPVYILRPAFLITDPGKPRKSKDGRVLTDQNRAILYEREPAYGYLEEVKVVIDVEDTTGDMEPEVYEISDITDRLRRLGITICAEEDQSFPVQTPDGYAEDAVFHVPARLCRETEREKKVLLALYTNYIVCDIGQEGMNPSSDHLDFVSMLTRTVTERILFNDSPVNQRLLCAKGNALPFEEKRRILRLVSFYTARILMDLTEQRLTFFDTAMVNHLFGTGDKMELDGMLQKVMREGLDSEIKQEVFFLAERLAGSRDGVTEKLYQTKLKERGIYSFPPYLLKRGKE